MAFFADPGMTGAAIIVLVIDIPAADFAGAAFDRFYKAGTFLDGGHLVVNGASLARVIRGIAGFFQSALGAAAGFAMGGDHPIFVSVMGIIGIFLDDVGVFLVLPLAKCMVAVDYISFGLAAGLAGKALAALIRAGGGLYRYLSAVPCVAFGGYRFCHILAAGNAFSGLGYRLLHMWRPW